jgi:hypothetical protein
MIRTDAVAVEAVLKGGNDYSPRRPDLTPYITAASMLIDDVATYAQLNQIALATDRLTVMETWVAAHAYVTSDPNYQEKKTGESRGKYVGVTGMFLEGTRYGQMAIMLDPTGTLKAISKGNTARIEWLGLPAAQQKSYDDRNNP